MEIYNRMNNFDIGITTFSLRFDFINSLIKKIREFKIKNNVFLCINGEQNGDFDEDYRKKVLKLCYDYDNIYPIFFTEVRGLSKMWNTLIIHSSKKDMLILNDDIDIFTKEIFEVTSNHIISSEYFGLTKINNSFSFFIVNKKFIDELGYFDERLLGFGEEDGDITYRLMSKKNKGVCEISVNGVNNIVSEIRHNFIKPGIWKYSLFNREFMFKEKYKFENDGRNIRGMFDDYCTPLLEDEKQYPYENFFNDNKHKLER